MASTAMHKPIQKAPGLLLVGDQKEFYYLGSEVTEVSYNGEKFTRRKNIRESKLGGFVAASARIAASAKIHSSAVVLSGAVIQDRAFVGFGAIVCEGATVKKRARVPATTTVPANTVFACKETPPTLFATELKKVARNGAHRGLNGVSSEPPHGSPLFVRQNRGNTPTKAPKYQINDSTMACALVDLPKLASQYTHAIVALGIFTLRFTRHTNPDGTPGGFVSSTAKVAASAVINQTSVVEGHALVMDGVVISEYTAVGAYATITPNQRLPPYTIIQNNGSWPSAEKIVL